EDLVAMATKTAADQPPFVMQIVEAEEIREVAFDPLTGRPIGDSSSSKLSRTPRLPVQPANTPVPTGATGGQEVDFPIDFLDD
ncbi:MAG: hypothetical protein ACR2NU_01715, partial [Aeoliella sp.]